MVNPIILLYILCHSCCVQMRFSEHTAEHGQDVVLQNGIPLADHCECVGIELARVGWH